MLFKGLFRREQQPSKAEPQAITEPNIYDDLICRIHNSIVDTPERWSVALRWSHRPPTGIDSFEFWDSEVCFSVSLYSGISITKPYELSIRDFPSCDALRDLVEKAMGMDRAHQAKVSSALLGREFRYRFALAGQLDTLEFRSWFFHKCQDVFYVQCLYATDSTSYDIRFKHEADAILFKMEFSSAVDVSFAQRRAA